MIKRFFYYLLSFFNRFAHWFDLVFYYYIINWVYNNQFSSSKFGWLIYLVLVVQLVFCVKYEFLVIKSKAVCEDILSNGRVMSFMGKQGAGKSSFACFLAANKRFKNVYSNSPLKLRQKYTCILEKDILNLDCKIDDYSLITIDEATLFYHNLKSQNNNKLSNELYAQEIMTQCVRHFFDGNIFYISTDCNRLPKVIKENIGITNLLLGQGTKCISFLTGNLIKLIGKLFGFKFYNGLRYWDVQQFEKIPEQQYTFDLSNQEKDTDLKRFANLIRVYTFNNPNLFDYHDRFLAGVYDNLPSHSNKYWQSLDYDEKLLRHIGYGELINFFDGKNFVNKDDGDGNT